MLIYIRFLGVLSVKFGASPISVHIEPNYPSLQSKIQELMGCDPIPHYVLLQNGKPFDVSHHVFCSQDEFCVFFPISGG